MICRSVYKKFSLLRDRELSLSQKKEVQAHLSQCEKCAGEWEIYNQSLGVLQYESSAFDSRRVWQRFWQSINEKKLWYEELVLFRAWGMAAVSVALFLLIWTWVHQVHEEQYLAAQIMFTHSQYGKVLSIF